MSFVERNRGKRVRSIQTTLRPCKTVEKQRWTRTDYFQTRHKKLNQQAPSPKTQLLHHKHVYFNSVRSDSQRSLEALVWRHGGTVHKNFARTVITHVIADNLCISKLNNEINALSSFNGRSSPVFVRPAWLLQSIANQRLLPTWDFQLVRNRSDTATIDTFFQAKKSITPNRATDGKKKMCKAERANL